MSQVNVVVPDEHADLVRRVGKGLREIESFPEALRQFLDGDHVVPEHVRQSLAQQVADAVLAAIGPAISGQAGATRQRRQAAPTPQLQQFKMEL
jgi:hypothetical protein